MPPHRLPFAEVGRLLGVDGDELFLLIELHYLPERSPGGGSVSHAALLALLSRSLWNARIRRLRLAERAAWMRHPELLRTIADFRFAPGSIGEVLQEKLLPDPPDHDDPPAEH